MGNYENKMKIDNPQWNKMLKIVDKIFLNKMSWNITKNVR